MSSHPGRVRCRVFAFCAAILFAVAALAAEPSPAAPADPSVEDLERQVEQARAATRAYPEEPGTWGVLTMSEIVLANGRAQAAAGGAPVDPAALAAESRAISARILEEWKRARPNDATPYLVEMQSTVPPAEQDDHRLALLERFPDDPRLLSQVVRILSGREQAARAGELVEGALARHGEVSELWSVAVRYYADQNNESRRRELVNAWVERLPGDANALENWLSSADAARDRALAQARVERFAAAPTAGLSDAQGNARVGFCERLLDLADGAYREPARRCLVAAAAAARTEAPWRARAAVAVASLTAEAGDSDGGDLAGFVRTLAAMSAEERRTAIFAAIVRRPNDDCAGKLQLARLLPAEEPPRNWLGLLKDCATDAEVQGLYLHALERAPSGDLAPILSGWFFKVNGRYLEDRGLAPRLVAVLEERAKHGIDDGVRRALATAYEIAGRDDRRAALLAAWISSGSSGFWSEDALWLADWQAGHGELDVASATLATALERTQAPVLALRLGDLLLAAGKPDDLSRLAARLAADDAPGMASTAHLIRARALLAAAAGQGALGAAGERALGEYRAYFESAEYPTRAAAAEMLLLAGAAGGGAPPGMAEQVCAHDSVRRPQETPAQCAAALLAASGEEQGALAALELAVARSPEDLRLQASLAQATLDLGAWDRAEQIYRRMLKIDPESQVSWLGLSQVAVARADVEACAALLGEAERARGERPPEMVVAFARLLREQGQARRAVALLLELRDRMPNNPGFVDVELRLAYLAAADEPAGGPAPQTAAPLSASSSEVGRQLEAMREIDAARFGLRGAIDEGAMRAAVEREAAAGNPYAGVLLAIFTHGGWFGIAADEARAIAKATPHLAALRASAERGDSYGQYLWGTLLLRGLAVPKRPEEAADWLRRAADQGELGAMYNLGYMAANGDGAPRDTAAAVRWYARAAEAGHASAIARLAEILLAGDAASRRPAEGAKWLEKAAERGERTAVAWWSARLLYGGDEGAPPDFSRVRPWLEKAAGLGEPRGIYNLAVALLAGIGGDRDEARGVALLERLAAGGDPSAALQLAWQSALGRGTRRDAGQAAAWLARAAARGGDDLSLLIGAAEEQPKPMRGYFQAGAAELEKLAESGDAFAGGLLSRLYLSGDGVALDPQRAVTLARRAAEGRSGEAMRTLGWAYRQGTGVEADADQAAVWWRRGAEAGNSFCMMWLSQMLYRGEGGTKDPEAALAWLVRSGEAGNYWAIGDLAHHYDEGTYGARDPEKAELWMRRAAASGNREAVGWLKAHGLAP